MRVFIFILLGFSQLSFGDTKIPGQLSISLGSISANYAEKADQLTTTDGTTAAATTPFAGTASSMPISLMYEYFPNLKRSYFAKATGPLLGSTPDRYFSGNIGLNFYFGKVATMAIVSDSNFEMKLIPKLRYYVGPSMGMGYLIYNTKSAIKNDLLLELGGQAGVVYTMNPSWAVRGELGASRGVGALVSATVIKILMGVSFNISNQ
jgi:hypothetical protein